MTGNWFYAFIVMGIVIPLWLVTQQLIVAVLVLDMLLVTFYGYVPEIIYPYVALMNVFAFAHTIFYKPMAPKYTS